MINEKVAQIGRYLIVGGINTAVGYAIFSVCYLTLRTVIAYALILVLAHFVAVTFSFLTQNKYVFSETSGNRRTSWQMGQAWLRFQVAYIALLAIGLAVNFMALRWISSSPWIAQAIALIAGVPVGYLIQKNFVFGVGPTQSKNATTGLAGRAPGR